MPLTLTSHVRRKGRTVETEDGFRVQVRYAGV
jgi:hypothetical protein